MAKQKTYIAIDLKSFYASVECKERNRDPLTTNLVVADQSRTEKTICLAVSPSLKSYGIPGRPNRASAKMAYHVLDTIDQIMKSAETGAFEKVPSTCERPEAMPNS